MTAWNGAIYYQDPVSYLSGRQDSINSGGVWVRYIGRHG